MADDMSVNTGRRETERPTQPHSFTGVIVVPKLIPRSMQKLEPYFKQYGDVLQRAATTSGTIDPSNPVARGLLKFCISALQIGRPLGSVIIMLYGESGTGKSCTINRLFKQEVCAEGNPTIQSETTDCTEISTLLVNKRENVKFNMNLIDVPGTCDSEGDVADKRNAATIRKFLVTHDQLGQKDGRPTFALPNVVILTFNVVEIKFPKKKGSNFYKSLEALKATGTIDRERLNLVIVGTHAMRVPERGDKWTERMTTLRTLIAEVAKDVLELDTAWDVPVVFVENDPKKDSGYEYDQSQEFVMLPDGSRSHYNLFLALFKLFSTAGDHLGLLALGTAWMVQDGEDKQRLRPEVIRRVKNEPENLNCEPFRPPVATVQPASSDDSVDHSSSVKFAESQLAKDMISKSGLERKLALEEYGNLLKVLWRLKYFSGDKIKGQPIQLIENALPDKVALSPGERKMLTDYGMVEDKDMLVLVTDNQASTSEIGELVADHVADNSGVWSQAQQQFAVAWDGWLKNAVQSAVGIFFHTGITALARKFFGW